MQQQKGISIQGSFYSSDSISFHTPVNCKDIIIDENFTISGNLQSRDITVGGTLTVADGFVNAKGDIEAGENIIVIGNCECYSISAGKDIIIYGNVSASSISSHNGNIYILGNFNGDINNISVSDECHIYINDKFIK